MVIAIDIDGCLADFNTAYGNAVVKVTGVDLFPKGWQDSPTFPTTWNWDLDAGYTAEQSKMVWEKAILSNNKFWASLDPLPGAEETLANLNRLRRKGHDIYFLTHRMGKNAKFQTEQWLEECGMPNATVILTGQKVPVLLSINAEFFVDDKLATMNEVYRAYTDLRRYGTLRLIDAPYNQLRRERGLKSSPSVRAALEEAGLWIEERRGRPRKETNGILLQSGGVSGATENTETA